MDISSVLRRVQRLLKKGEDRLAVAIHLAGWLHREQQRNNGSPYLSHLLAVIALIFEAGGTENQAIGGAFHDSLEDQGHLITADHIADLFGPEPAQIALDCSDSIRGQGTKLPWYPRKCRYIEGLPRKPPLSLLVITADKTHNTGCLADEHEVKGDPMWLHFSSGAAGALWYQSTLLQTLTAVWPENPLLGRYRRKVERLRHALRHFPPYQPPQLVDAAGLPLAA